MAKKTSKIKNIIFLVIISYFEDKYYIIYYNL